MSASGAVGSRHVAIAAVVAIAGCYGSLVNDPCATGYTMQHGACVARATEPDGGVGDGRDGGIGHDGDGGATPDGTIADAGAPIDAFVPDAMTCPAPTTICSATCVDLSIDPDNCGHCGRVCPSGLCTAGTCVGSVVGHVVAIGHDFSSADGAMIDVFANALALGSNGAARIGWWRGTATVTTAAETAGHTGLGQLGRTWLDTQIAGDPTAETLANLDVLVVEAQTGDGAAAQATGARWSTVVAAFLTAGHVVVVLEGAGGVSYALAHGAGLYTVGAPIDVANQVVTVTTPTDEIAAGVPSPYLAKATSAAYPAAAGAVVTTASGAVVVLHQTY
jgi:hypothetical protein